MQKLWVEKKRLGLAEGQSRCKISEEGGCLACPRNSRGTQYSQGNGGRKGSAQEIRAGSLLAEQRQIMLSCSPAVKTEFYFDAKWEAILEIIVKFLYWEKCH